MPDDPFGSTVVTAKVLTEEMTEEVAKEFAEPRYLLAANHQRRNSRRPRPPNRAVYSDILCSSS